VVIASYGALQLAFLVLLSQSQLRAHKISTGAAALAFIASVTTAGLSFLEHSKTLRPSILLGIFLFVSLLLDGARARTLLMISSSWTLGKIFTAAGE
jgi:ATP-binding cassette subfamily C (CFTR/MRP) protein 1